MEFEEKKSGDILKFYVTVGRGLSGLVAGMLKTSEFQVDQITEGKIFFWCPRRPEPSEEALLQLKGVERIFLQLGFWLFETEPQPDEIVSFLDGLACKVPLVYEDWKYRQNPQSSDEIPAKRRKVLGSTTFRVNVKLAGTVGRRLNFSVVSKRFAHQLITEGNSDWTVDLHSPVVEISIHINDRSCIVGIPLTKSPLSNRKYLKQPGLR